MLPTGEDLVVPSRSETLRLKAVLVLLQNRARDYLDLAALANRYGSGSTASCLAQVGDYYADEDGNPLSVQSQLIRQLSSPSPADVQALNNLKRDVGLSEYWQDWSTTKEVLADIADLMGEGIWK